jgi:hypothetical protein
MDIYLPTASTPLILNVFRRSRLRIIKYVLLMGGALAMSGCLSLRLGGDNSSPTTVRQTADLSSAEAVAACLSPEGSTALSRGF